MKKINYPKENDFSDENEKKENKKKDNKKECKKKTIKKIKKLETQINLNDEEDEEKELIGNNIKKSETES